VVAIYSTFLQRGYDQLIHDVALQNLPVVFALDRAGMVGADGATHAAPTTSPMCAACPTWPCCPADERECRKAAVHRLCPEPPGGRALPARRRVPASGRCEATDLDALPWARARCDAVPVRPGGRMAILAFGTCCIRRWPAAEALDATVVNMRWAKPLDEALLLEVARTHDALVTVEEGACMGGAGSAVAECLAAAGVSVPLLHLGLPDRSSSMATRPSCWPCRAWTPSAWPS
jgi:1-deoxy-D-xylulose-5-phosphate synthase